MKRKDETLEPLVSIVVTLYNIKIEYVKEMINSLLNQSYKNIEILCMDDCSPVDYSELIKTSCKVKLTKNEKNIGMHKSVNKAFKLSKGKYVVRLGGDDIFDKDLIKKEVEYLENNPNMDAVCCQLKCFGNSDRRINRPNKWDLEKILNGNYGGTGYAGGMMFKQSLLKYISIDESFKMCEDFDFHLQILEHGHIGSIHEDLYFYRSHSESLCNSIKRAERIQIFERVLEKHRKIYQSSIKDKV